MHNPPGFPDDDNDGPDGGGPPERQRDTAPDAIARILARNGALSNARIAAQNWADVAGKRTYVVRNGEYFFPADLHDLVQWHMLDLYLGRARIVWRSERALPSVAAPDVAFAPSGWAE